MRSWFEPCGLSFESSGLSFKPSGLGLDPGIEPCSLGIGLKPCGLGLGIEPYRHGLALESVVMTWTQQGGQRGILPKFHRKFLTQRLYL